MSLKKLYGVVFLSVIVTGCTSIERVQIEKFWQKRGYSYEDAKLQYRLCHAKASRAAERKTQMGAMIENCMQLEGYKWGTYRFRLR